MFTCSVVRCDLARLIQVPRLLRIAGSDVICQRFRNNYYFRRRLVSLLCRLVSVCHAVCVSAPLVSAAKVMRCIQCSLVCSFCLAGQFLPARRYASAVFATATFLDVCLSGRHTPVLCENGAF